MERIDNKSLIGEVTFPAQPDNSEADILCYGYAVFEPKNPDMYLITKEEKEEMQETVSNIKEAIRIHSETLMAIADDVQADDTGVSREEHAQRIREVAQCLIK